MEKGTGQGGEKRVRFQVAENSFQGKERNFLDVLGGGQKRKRRYEADANVGVGKGEEA